MAELMFIFGLENWVRFSFFVSRISYFVSRGARNRPIRGRRRTQRAPTIGGACAFDAKKVLDLGLPMHVSRFWQASKKNLDFWIFGFRSMRI